MSANEDKILYKDLSYKVEDKIILELKSSEGIVDIYRAQTLNYLKATKMRLAIILIFGKEKLEYERIVQ